MINTSLVQLLKSLNKDEFHNFEDLVNSPFFNKKTPVLHLFNYLKDFYPHFDNADKLDRKNVYNALYPGKSYNYGFFKNIIYDLNILGEKFIELTGYKENKPEQYRFLLEGLTKRDLDMAFKKNLKNAESLLNDEIRNDIYYRNKMELELLKFNFHIKKSGRTIKPDFERIAGNFLTAYFLIKYFKINYNNLISMLNFGKPENFPFLDEILIYLSKNNNIDPVILFYYNKFMLLFKEKEIFYNDFKNLFKQQIHTQDRKEKYNTYVNLLNFCYGKIASGEWKYYNDLFDIYSEMINSNIFSYTEKDYFDPVHFRLAAETAVKLHKFDWAKEFIEKYSEKLPPNHIQNEIYIAYANYFFMGKNYDEAQKHLSKIQLNSVYDKVYIYILQSMLYYETKQFETLLSAVDSIKHFISNDKVLSEENRNSFRKYINYLSELLNLNIRKGADTGYGIGRIKMKLNSENSVLEKKWLIEKLDDLNGL